MWAEKGISKGIIYHYYKDKDELYLLCVKTCFDAVTAYLKANSESLSGTVQNRLQAYFNARLRFFSENPEYLGIFIDASFHPAEKLLPQISTLRQDFDTLNISVLTELLKTEPLRPGLSVELVVDDFRMYMDYFNMHFKVTSCDTCSQEDLLREHEKQCHRQLNILLYGVLDEKK